MFEFLIANWFGYLGAFFVVLITSMMPVLEMHAAVPLGMSTALWGNGAMSVLGATLTAFLGSCISGIIVFLLFKPVLNWFKKTKKFSYLSIKIKQNILSKNKKNITEKKKFWWCVGFIALPIPFTGIWTGAMLISLYNFKIFKGILCLIIGNLISALFIFLLCSIFYELIDLILLCITIVFILMLVYYILKYIIENFPKQNKI